MDFLPGDSFYNYLVIRIIFVKLVGFEFLYLCKIENVAHALLAVKVGSMWKN